MSDKQKVMDIQFSLFNYHVNNAKEKAKNAFIKRFSQADWNNEIQPFEDAGIMSIFNTKPNEKTRWFVETVGVYVNELV